MIHISVCETLSVRTVILHWPDRIKPAPLVLANPHPAEPLTDDFVFRLRETSHPLAPLLLTRAMAA